MICFQPAWSKTTSTFEPTWSRMVNVDQFCWMLWADMLDQLAMAKDDLGFDHVRACGMLDDKMKAWTIDPADFRLPEGERPRHLNFQVIDKVIDRLTRLDVKPLYTTCFTPSDMASGTLEIWQHSNTTQPKDLKQWSKFVQAGIEHEIAHRGLEEVQSWYFECWNEANLQGCFFGGTQAEWFELWAATYEGVKAACPDLRVGGPSTARGEWIGEFLDWTKERGCEPDYLISHFYNNDSDSAPLSPFDGPASAKVKDSPHFGAGVVRGTRKLLNDRGFRGEIHWNEWGRSWFPQDDLKETALEAAYIVKTMAEVSDQAEMFAFWCLSDIYDQAGFGRKAFQGNYGMLNMHGLRKPAYFAHMLLNRTVGQRVEVPAVKEDLLQGAVATKSSGGYNVLVYLYPENVEQATVSETVKVTLPADARNPRLYRIDRENHNIIKTWKGMGAPDYLERGLQKALKDANQLTPEFTALKQSLSDTGLELEFSLDRPGVALVQAETSERLCAES